MNPHLNHADHPLDDAGYVQSCKTTLDSDGALVLSDFFTAAAIAEIVAASAPREHEAFYAASTHNVYLTPNDPDRPDDVVYNRQVASSKGLIADDQIPTDSPLRAVLRRLQLPVVSVRRARDRRHLSLRR